MAVRPRAMAMPNGDRELLFVVCNDYGELSLAMYLLAGQEFARRTTLMLPPRLADANPDVLPGRTLAYHSAADVLREMEARRPGVLGLFSGQLLLVEDLFAGDALRGLLQSARERDARVFSSDPFFALLDEHEPDRLVDIRARRQRAFYLRLFDVVLGRVAKRKLARQLSQAQELLHGVPCVYPVDPAPADGAPARAPRLRLHFHNPAFASAAGDAAPAAADAGAAPEGAPRPARQWLFVLGDLDYGVQSWAYGRSRFHRTLVHKLHETLRASREPVLIAPPAVIESVRRLSPVAGSMRLSTHCDFGSFLALLREAEYVFYWNAVSFSGLLRFVLGLPWFTFDDGHLMRILAAPYAERITQWYYRGGPPPRLDAGAALTAEALQQANTDYQHALGRIRWSLAACPSPEEMIATLCAAGVPEGATEPPAGAIRVAGK